MNIGEIDMENEMNCVTCLYFLNCKIEKNEDKEYCKIHPEALGYCELWGGPIINYNTCHGYAPK